MLRFCPFPRQVSDREMKVQRSSGFAARMFARRRTTRDRLMIAACRVLMCINNVLRQNCTGITRDPKQP